MPFHRPVNAETPSSKTSHARPVDLLDEAASDANWFVESPSRPELLQWFLPYWTDGVEVEKRFVDGCMTGHPTPRTSAAASVALSGRGKKGSSLSVLALLSRGYTSFPILGQRIGRLDHRAYHTVADEVRKIVEDALELFSGRISQPVEDEERSERNALIEKVALTVWRVPGRLRRRTQ